jgi:hypothetical protein
VIAGHLKVNALGHDAISPVLSLYSNFVWLLVYKEGQKLFNFTVFTTLVRGKVKIFLICYSGCVICGKSVTIWYQGL